MDEFVRETLAVQLAGIEAGLWVSFFKTYAETATVEQVEKRLTRARQIIQRSQKDGLT